MTDGKFDALLKQGLIDAITRDWIDAPLIGEPATANSIALDRKIYKLAENPHRYVKAQTRPLYMKVLRNAAAVLLVISTLLAASMLNAEARAWFRQLIRDWFPDRNEYSFDEKYGQAIDRDWIFNYIPDGYELVLEDVTEHSFYREYENNQNKLLRITISGGEGTSFKDNEHYEIVQVKIQNDIAEAYMSLDPDFSNSLVWHSSKHDVLIFIRADIDIDELVLVAEGIK